MSAEQNPGQELPEELKTIETALRRITPRGSQIDRDRLMYLAGQASVTQADLRGGTIGLARPKIFAERNLWPITTAALALISVMLGGLLWRASSLGPPMVYVELPQTGNQSYVAWAGARFANETRPISNTPNYLQLRNFVLVHGNGALPPMPAANNLNDHSRQPTLPTLQHQWFGDES